jgi:hypothetical protein
VERGLVETVHVSDLRQDIGTELKGLYLTGEICDFYIYYEMGYAADMEIVQSIHGHDNEPRIDRRRASDDRYT